MPVLRLRLGLRQGQAEGQLFALAVVLICQVYGTVGGGWVWGQVLGQQLPQMVHNWMAP